MRTTPFRRTTLQCSQIGFTLLRTFTSTSPHSFVAQHYTITKLWSGFKRRSGRQNPHEQGLRTQSTPLGRPW